ncbi:diphosphoinositol polyphosphate phosphohydrolase 1-like isoform X1 [Hemitrygon akajei]|uniref:diphosphoinositol polyphosphate phosphohydrolase 1-like isoform X1 n=1 Tax=Hemitrygon akajei TaxID=2704970 RepID=UPI003BF9F60C
MMKIKDNQTRTYDGEGYKKRAACLCFKSDCEEEVLLVSSSRHPDQWIVPGGGMEPDEEPGNAAVREVYEEAGVKGKLGRLLGIFENRDRKHRTYVYILIVTEILEDWEDSVNIGCGVLLPVFSAQCVRVTNRFSRSILPFTKAEVGDLGLKKEGKGNGLRLKMPSRFCSVTNQYMPNTWRS